MVDKEAFIQLFGLTKSSLIGGYELMTITLEEEATGRLGQHLYRLRYIFLPRAPERSIKTFLETVLAVLGQEKILRVNSFNSYQCIINNLEIIPGTTDLQVKGIGRAHRKSWVAEPEEESENRFSCPNIYGLVSPGRPKFSSSPRNRRFSLPKLPLIIPRLPDIEAGRGRPVSWGDALPEKPSSSVSSLAKEVKFAPVPRLAKTEVFF